MGRIIRSAIGRRVALVLVVVLAGCRDPVVWQGSTDVAMGRGEVGPWRMNESRWDYVDDPAVAIDDRGGIVVAWVDQGREDVFFQRFSADGKRIDPPVNVSRSPGVFSWLPRVVVDRQERVFVLWQEIVFSGGSHGGDIFFARSEDGGRSFSAPVNLSTSIEGDGKGQFHADRWHNGSLDLALSADGALYASWTEFEGALWVRRSVDGGKTFSERRRINGATPARGPALAVGSQGIVHVGWAEGDAVADILVATSTDGGESFGAPVLVARTKSRSDGPKLVVDTAGTLHVVRSDSQRILHSRSTDGGRTFAAPRAISGTGAAFPTLGVDGRNQLHVLWEPAGRRGLMFAVSKDGGATFAAPIAVPHSAGGGYNGSLQGLSRKLAVNRHGALAIVNSSFEENVRSRVWLMRGQLRQH